MNMLRWIGLAFLVGGCGSESNPGQIGFAPISDAGINTSVDVGQDLADAEVVPKDVGVLSDMLDASDVVDATADATLGDAADAAADMAESCWGERTGLSSGLPCGDTTASGQCNLVTQTGCLDQKYCSFIFNGTGLVAGCTLVEPQCGFLKFGDVCLERVGQSSQSLGICEPGSYCPRIAATETQSVCERYCESKTGLGCSPEEVCVQIMNGQSAQSLAGYGVCSVTAVCAL